jgi:hypothetical protein
MKCAAQIEPTKRALLAARVGKVPVICVMVANPAGGRLWRRQVP